MAATRESALRTGSRPVVGAALITGAASLWATFGLFAKHLYAAGYTPLELASVRAFTGCCGIAVFALAHHAFTRAASVPAAAAPSARVPALGALARVRVPTRALPFLAAYGVFGFACFEYAFFAALDRTSVAVAVALLYTAPAFVVLASALFWHEHIGRSRWLALAFVLAGVLLVTGALSALRSGTATLPAAALLFGITSGATYALYTMLSKIAAERYGSGAALFWSFLFATIALAFIASPIEPLLRDRQHLLSLLGLGIVPTLLPYALYLTGLRQLRASTAAMLAAVEPAIATVLAALLLGEAFTAAQGMGVGFIVLAAVLLARTDGS